MTTKFFVWSKFSLDPLVVCVDCAVQRLLGADEDPGEVVDFWGKSKVGTN